MLGTHCTIRVAVRIWTPASLQFPPPLIWADINFKFEHRLVLALYICQLYEKEAKSQHCNIIYGEMHWHIAFSFPKNPKINITTLHAPGSHWHPSKNWPYPDAHKWPTLSLTIAHKGWNSTPKLFWEYISSLILKCIQSGLKCILIYPNWVYQVFRYLRWLCTVDFIYHKLSWQTVLIVESTSQSFPVQNFQPSPSLKLVLADLRNGQSGPEALCWETH